MSDTEYQGVPEEAAATEFEVRPRLDGEQLRAIVEALIFASPEPLTPKLLFKLLADEPREDVSAAVEAVRQDYANRAGLHVVEVAGGYQITTRPELHEWVRRLFHERSTQKLSVAALETLSVVAYKQPITQAEIGEIRGVNTSGVLSTLLERHLIKIVGRKNVIGRPFLERAQLNLPNGKRFTVRAEGLSEANRYVGRVTLNGKPLACSFLKHEDIGAGGELVFTMQARPNKEWGKERAARPYTQTAYQP